jgi:RNA-directed DNA polymerase
MIATEVSKLLGMTTDEFLNYAKTCPWRYKVYTVAKRNGGKRIIAQPSKSLKALQVLIRNRYLAQLPIHKAATAYQSGLNIKDNATPHLLNPFILKMDFSNFFPSIVPTDLHKHLSKFPHQSFPAEDLQLFSQIFFYRPKEQTELQLSIGAPTSPFISNTLLFSFDEEVTQNCVEHSVTYTRYADDLTFSAESPSPLRLIKSIVEKKVNEFDYPKLSINREKTILVSKAHRRMITGLIINNDGNVSLGRKTKRTLKSKVHQYTLGSKDDVASLRGWLWYANSVEPSFVEALKAKYSERVILDIMKKTRPAHD